MKEFKYAAITGNFGFLFNKQSGREITMNIAMPSFPKSSLNFHDVYRPHKNEKLVFAGTFGFRNVFEKLIFSDGLVWTVGLIIEINLRFLA